MTSEFLLFCSHTKLRLIRHHFCAYVIPSLQVLSSQFCEMSILDERIPEWSLVVSCLF
jgi:hypothetical protein